MKVYLAGPINSCSIDGARQRRAAVLDALHAKGYEPLDPLRPGHHLEEGNWPVGQIIDRDLADIAACDAVLCDVRGIVAERLIPCGTFMEVYEATRYGKKPVVTIADDFHSIWLSHFSTVVVGTLDEALARLAEVTP